MLFLFNSLIPIKMFKKKLFVVIGCDCDPDRPEYGGMKFDQAGPAHQWMGVKRGIADLSEACRAIRDGEGKGLKVTWLLRADEQIGLIHGDWAYSLREHSPLWQALQDSGHELGWHPHLWRWNQDQGFWYQEVEDEPWIEHCLKGGFEAFSEALGRPKSARMGWVYHNNFTMRIFDELCIRVDLSGVPGQRFPRGPDKRGSLLIGGCDWSITPERPYYPSVKDYRRPAQQGEKTLKVLELPNSTMKSYPLVLLKALRLLFKGQRLSLSLSPWISLSMTAPWPFFKKVVALKIKALKSHQEALLVGFFHADELLPPGGPLWKKPFYSAHNMVENLKNLLLLCQEREIGVEFITAGQAVERLSSSDLARNNLERHSLHPESL